MVSPSASGIQESHGHVNRIMIRIRKACVNGFYIFHPDIRGDNEAINDIILRIFSVGGIVGLVEQTACRATQIIGIGETIRKQAAVQLSRGPEIAVAIRVNVRSTGEILIEITAGNHIISFCVFGSNKFPQLL